MGMSWGETGRAAVLDDVRRDACLHSLGDHYAAGRLSADELDARIQFALAAETDEDLASVMQDLVEEPAVDQDVGASEQQAPRVGVRGVRWAAAGGGLVTGGVIVAVAGHGSNALEFAVGLAVGLLGFIAHWGLFAPSALQQSTDDAPAVRPAAPDLSDPSAEGHVDPSDPTVATTAPGPTRTGPVPRRVQHNGGIIPPQRRRD